MAKIHVTIECEQPTEFVPRLLEALQKAGEVERYFSPPPNPEARQAPPRDEPPRDPDWLRDAASAGMTSGPGDFVLGFGKHAGKALRQIPRDYVEWMARKMEPKGKGGQEAQAAARQFLGEAA